MVRLVLQIYTTNPEFASKFGDKIRKIFNYAYYFINTKYTAATRNTKASI